MRCEKTINQSDTHGKECSNDAKYSVECGGEKPENLCRIHLNQKRDWVKRFNMCPNVNTKKILKYNLL